MKSSSESSQRDRIKNLIYLIFIVASITWIFQIEFYPLSAWQMYSNNVTEKNISYTKLYAYTANGKTFRTDLREMIGALSETRFMDNLLVFVPHAKSVEFEKTNKLLQRCAEIYNSDPNHKDKIDRFEIQIWELDPNNKSDLNAMVKNYVYQVT